MATLDFSKAHDFQLLFDNLQTVAPLLDLTPLGEIEIINQRSKNSGLESEQILQLDNTFQNPFFWEKLYKYEPKILRYVHSISIFTLQTRAAIQDYNFHLKNKGRSILVPDAVEFQCLELLWNIVAEEEKRNSSSSKANLDQVKFSA